MAKGREYRVVWVDNSSGVEDALNKAARDGFKIAGTTAQALILERKAKKSDDDDDKDEDDDKDGKREDD